MAGEDDVDRDDPWEEILLGIASGDRATRTASLQALSEALVEGDAGGDAEAIGRLAAALALRVENTSSPERLAWLDAFRLAMRAGPRPVPPLRSLLERLSELPDEEAAILVDCVGLACEPARRPALEQLAANASAPAVREAATRGLRLLEADVATIHARFLAAVRASEHDFYEIRERASQPGWDWNDFSEAKGNHRFIAGYASALAAVDPGECGTTVEYRARVERLLYESSADPDYADPHSARDHVLRHLHTLDEHGPDALALEPALPAPPPVTEPPAASPALPVFTLPTVTAAQRTWARARELLGLFLLAALAFATLLLVALGDPTSGRGVPPTFTPFVYRPPPIEVPKIDFTIPSLPPMPAFTPLSPPPALKPITPVPLFTPLPLPSPSPSPTAEP